MDKIFKESLYDRIKEELPTMSLEAEFNLYKNNENLFNKEYDENFEGDLYYLKDVKEYSLNNLIYIAQCILEGQGNYYNIVDYINDKLIFEGYTTREYDEYNKRLSQLK